MAPAKRSRGRARKTRYQGRAQASAATKGTRASTSRAAGNQSQARPGVVTQHHRNSSRARGVRQPPPAAGPRPGPTAGVPARAPRRHGPRRVSVRSPPRSPAAPLPFRTHSREPVTTRVRAADAEGWVAGRDRQDNPGPGESGPTHHDHSGSFCSAIRSRTSAVAAAAGSCHSASCRGVVSTTPEGSSTAVTPQLSRDRRPGGGASTGLAARYQAGVRQGGQIHHQWPVLLPGLGRKQLDQLSQGRACLHGVLCAAE